MTQQTNCDAARNDETMVEFEAESKQPTAEDCFRLYAERLQLWRLCRQTSCLRAHACRGDPHHCCSRFADWAEAVKTAAMRERHANDPAAQALRAELGQRLRRLAATLRDEP
ncbi:MAG: hypothetical protein ACM3MH_07260 [Actinomycetota bacterium]